MTIVAIFSACDSKPEKVSNKNFGKKLYKSCIQCHGKKGEKKTLQKGQIISSWSKKQIVDALLGYKKKIYGRSMKTIMYKPVSNLTKKDMEQIADYIVQINKK